ncbi:MAG: hypothetical protein M1834_004298 [Cirrosporium novae-zelandiae]|nr:MAG: hypothetical protein M1834_004298 [Cirrosporium novae-zelandiae]
MKSAVSVAALASSAAAFLIPPDIDAVSLPPKATEIDPMYIPQLNVQTLKLNCPGCPFAQPKEDGGKVWVEGVDNSLVLNFTLDNDNLSLNNVPLNLDNSLVTEPIFATQESADQTSELLPVSYLMMYPAPIVDAETHNQILDIHLKIIALAGQAITPDMVTVHAIKTPSGRMLLAEYETRPSDSDEFGWMSPTEEEDSNFAKDCTTSLCKAKAIMAAKVKEMMENIAAAKNRLSDKVKGCHGNMRPHGPPPQGPHGHHGMEDMMEGEPHPHHGPHPHHHPRPMMHHRHGKLATFLHIFLMMLVPLVLGIAAGIVVRIIGMVVGMLIVTSWRRIRGNRRHGEYESVEQADLEDAVIVNDEKEVVQHVDAPPQYEELEGTAVEPTDRKE